LASSVAVDFDFASAADCRVAGIPFLYVLPTSNERETFLNNLTSFDYALWGCGGAAPPTDFALLYAPGLTEDPRPVTTADVDALIEDYLAVAKPRLTLSQNEIDELDRALHVLAKQVVTLKSSAYSRSNCSSAGGAAGAAGEGATLGAAGSGGEGGR
jgi:hypothetical protein